MAKKIPKNSVEEIVKKSGNSFHYQVVNFLRSYGWTVSISPYYNDNLTDKPREIDIIAERGFDAQIFGQSKGTVNVKLFIECKYINTDIVFWFDSVNKESLVKRMMDDTGLQSPSTNVMINEHRFMAVNSVAKLFASKVDKLQENEIIYKALNQSLNAMVYYKNSSTIIPKNASRVQKILKTLNYPVIICNDFSRLHKVDFGTEDQPQTITDNFQLEVNYAYFNKDKMNISEYFIIDVVSFEKLKDFLSEIENKEVKVVSEAVAFEQHQNQK